MSWNLLERFLESEHFNKDPSLCIQYLARYADHVGIQHALCNRLRQFSYEELEFALPQLCQLLVSGDSESMALEEFVMDLCEESANAALLTFWLFQTFLHDMSATPQSAPFRTCSRIYNKVQLIVFGAASSAHRERIKENILPVMVLSSIILAGAACPFLTRESGPLAIAQARRPRPVDDVISDAGQAQKILKGPATGGHASRQRKKHAGTHSDADGKRQPRVHTSRSDDAKPKSKPKPNENPKDKQPALSQMSDATKPSLVPSALSSVLPDHGYESRLSSSSLPEIKNPEHGIPIPPLSAALPSTPPLSKRSRRHTHSSRALTPSSLARDQKIRLLRSNYFRNETAFLTALQDISNRLVVVPKQARLSALRAELALIAQDLPAEVDVPVICPATLDDGRASRSRHHRIVRLNPAEATSLNSAERVPYLLMVEVLREDFDFDPDSDENTHLLSKLLLEKGTPKRRLFDLTDATASDGIKDAANQDEEDSVLEPANGDLGASTMLNALRFDGDENLPTRAKSSLVPNGVVRPPIVSRTSGGANGRSSLTAMSTPRTSNTEISRAGSPGRKNARSYGPDQSDVSALATHMRTAAQMLAQLDQSSSKRPKTEVAAIKAKIIASMQSLEEQSFLMDDGTTAAPTFDSIMAKADAEATTGGDVGNVVFDESLEVNPETSLNSGAGAARMENDQKTGGVRRIGDRDDPSAATFGEDWTTKKERIRRSSPFGWMKNWDLVSMIVKTGADLRQEAFACQLIRVCAKIWEGASVPVWVKDMRILVTGESSGLIETITNGVSLHSLKRSLTLDSTAAGTNTRKRIATLRDHFVKTFGEADSGEFAAGVDEFTKSLAAYSIICYVLQLKDRHNGNILVDNAGHIIHIDFGFMLSNSPGSMGFEAAPFKLTHEYIDLLGGFGSPGFDAFKKLCKQAFQALRKEAEKLVSLVDIMGRNSRMPCFAAGGAQAVNALRARFVLHLTRDEAETYVEELIQKSAGSYYTRLYDTFQYRTQGIY